jgi:ArsR family transcriptional regulator
MEFTEAEGYFTPRQIAFIQEAKKTLRDLAHPMRSAMIETINKSGKEGITVGELQHTLKIEQSVTSAHLKELRSSGIARVKREGKFRVYTIDHDVLNQIMDNAEIIARVAQ